MGLLAGNLGVVACLLAFSACSPDESLWADVIFSTSFDCSALPCTVSACASVAYGLTSLTRFVSDSVVVASTFGNVDTLFKCSFENLAFWADTSFNASFSWETAFSFSAADHGAGLLAVSTGADIPDTSSLAGVLALGFVSPSADWSTSHCASVGVTAHDGALACFGVGLDLVAAVADIVFAHLDEWSWVDL